MALNGFLTAFVWPNLLPVIHSVFSPDTDTTTLGLWSTCSNFGNIFGFIIMQEVVLRYELPWELGMYIAAIYMMINAIYVLVRVEEIHNYKSQKSFEEST
jgi:sugar phosphate permease